MKNKKNIDRLFQEKFKDFETAPNEQTWTNIQAALQEKKKERRMVPIWFKHTGIAAAFILGFFALNSVYKITTETTKTKVLGNKMTLSKSHTTDSIITKKTQAIEKIYPKKELQLTADYDNKTKSTSKKSNVFSNKSQSEIKNTPTKHQNSIAVYQKKHHRPIEKSKLQTPKTKDEMAITEKSNPEHYFGITLNQDNTATFIKNNINPEIALSNSEDKKSLPPTLSNELEEILKEKEGKKDPIALKTQKNKWEIVPNVAPIYINTNSSGSAIDSQLSKNNKTGDTGFSYGIGINYALSDKIALRSGINAFSIGYNTNNVPYAVGLNTSSLANVTYHSNNALEIQSMPAYNSLSPMEKELQKTSMGSINQKMGYYEIPLEFSYAVLNKKIGINIIGGFSTLFLKQNEIVLVSPESSFKLGEANNLNSVHFSTNFGFGFKYKFVETFQLNFEPMLKYQVNTYSSETGNFKPIYIGLYSGISYRF